MQPRPRLHISSSGVVANLELSERAEVLFPYLPLLSLPFPSPLLCPSLQSVLPFSLRSRPLKSSYGVGESCKFPQRVMGQSPSGNQIWCILALKYDIWWQQF